MDDLRRWSKPATDSRRTTNRQWRVGKRRISGGYRRGSNGLERARFGQAWTATGGRAGTTRRLRRNDGNGDSRILFTPDKTGRGQGQFSRSLCSGDRG